jgi:hypothetical protein
MPIYPIMNIKTGEQKELNISISEWDKFKQENLDWTRDWTQGCASFGEVGEWKDRLIKKHPGWNEVLKKVGKSSNSNVSKI